MSSNPRQQYRYRSLDSACRGGRGFVNVYAVVAEYEGPKDTNGTDYCSRCVLKDASTKENGAIQSGVECMIFAKERNKLPTDVEIGDVVRMHRVSVGTYNDRPQFVLQVKNYGAFVMFRNVAGSGYAPYFSSTQNYTMEGNVDHALVDRMRQFARDNGIINRGGGVDGRSGRLHKIGDLLLGEFLNLDCVVLNVDRDALGLPVLWVWDATDINSEIFKEIFKEHGSIECQENEMDRDENVAQWRLAPPLNAVLEFPKIGTVLPILVSKENIELPKEGMGVRLCNILMKSVKGQVRGLFNKASWTELCGKATMSSLHDRRLRQSTVLNYVPENPCAQTTFNAPITPLREILRQAVEDFKRHVRVERSFKCCVRATQWSPKNVQDFLCQSYEHPKDSVENRGGEECVINNEGMGNWRLGAKFLMEDATGELDCVVHGTEAEEFFGCKASRFPQELGRIKKLMNDLSSIGMMCCIHMSWGRSDEPFFCIVDTRHT